MTFVDAKIDVFMSFGITLRSMLGQVLLSILLTLPIGQIRAETQLPIGRDGMPGGRHTTIATPQSALVVAGGAAELAHTESVLSSEDRHERISGELFGSFRVHPAFLLSASGLARVDVHRGEHDDRAGAIGSALNARARHAFLAEQLHVAADLRTIFPPAESPSLGFRAVSPELRALATYLAYESAFTLNAGYRIDRSARAIADPNALSEEGLLSASVSSCDALLLAVAASHAWLGVTWLVEWSYDLGVGDGAPSAKQSPMRFEGSVQGMASQRLAWGVHLGVSPSARPPFTTDPLVRIEPRIWLGANVAFIFDPRAESHAETAPAEPVTPAVEPLAEPVQAETVEPALPPGQIRGRVRSLKGLALRAEIEVSPLQLQAQTESDGSFAIDVAPGDYEVTVRAKGHVTQTRTATVEQNGVTILVIDLERSRP